MNPRNQPASGSESYGRGPGGGAEIVGSSFGIAASRSLLPGPATHLFGLIRLLPCRLRASGLPLPSRLLQAPRGGRSRVLRGEYVPAVPVHRSINGNFERLVRVAGCDADELLAANTCEVHSKRFASRARTD